MVITFLKIPSQRMETILSVIGECNTAIAGGTNTELHGVRAKGRIELRRAQLQMSGPSAQDEGSYWKLMFSVHIRKVTCSISCCWDEKLR